MLFLQELKKTVFSVSYIIFVIVITLFLYSQEVLSFGNAMVNEPQVGEDYGTALAEVPEVIMPAALYRLYSEFSMNNYSTYPIGFIKYVTLSDSEQMEIAGIISEITGIDKYDVYKIWDSSSEYVDDSAVLVHSDMDYADFCSLMQKADDILGGGSYYNEENLIKFGRVPISYEEAVQRYELVINSDKVTGGYARLFADYAVAMGMSLMPVFLAVIMCMKDRRAKMSEVIYTRKVSASKIIISRYFAIVTAAMIPVIILSYLSNASVWGMYGGVSLDYLAPLKYDLGWIMPTAMIVIALGMCLTELTNTPIAIVVQGFWWLVDLNAGIQSVNRSYSLFRLAPRHNSGTMSYFRTQDYLDNYSRLVFNRLLFAGISILLVAATIIIYESKRKGKLNGSIKFNKFKIRKSLSGYGSRENEFEA